MTNKSSIYIFLNFTFELVSGGDEHVLVASRPSDRVLLLVLDVVPRDGHVRLQRLPGYLDGPGRYLVHGRTVWLGWDGWKKYVRFTKSLLFNCSVFNIVKCSCCNISLFLKNKILTVYFLYKTSIHFLGNQVNLCL